MSVHSAMTHTFEVYERDSEADTWLMVHRGLRGSLQQLTPDGARRQMGSDVAEPNVDHTVRMGAEAVDYVTGGRRLRDQATGTEYNVQVARWRDKPRPGNLRVNVAQVPAATQG